MVQTGYLCKVCEKAGTNLKKIEAHERDIPITGLELKVGNLFNAKKMGSSVLFNDRGDRQYRIALVEKILPVSEAHIRQYKFSEYLITLDEEYPDVEHPYKDAINEVQHDPDYLAKGLEELSKWYFDKAVWALKTDSYPGKTHLDIVNEYLGEKIVLTRGTLKNKVR